MPAGSDATITQYQQSGIYTIPDGYMAFNVYNNGSNTGAIFGGAIVPSKTTLHVPFIGTTYNAIEVTDDDADLIITAFK